MQYFIKWKVFGLFELFDDRNIIALQDIAIYDDTCKRFSQKYSEQEVHITRGVRFRPEKDFESRILRRGCTSDFILIPGSALDAAELGRTWGMVSDFVAIIVVGRTWGMVSDFVAIIVAEWVYCQTRCYLWAVE